MTSFPSLKTGAIAQYPAARSTAYATHVVSFVDCSEQRFGGYSKPLRLWAIRLDLLDEQEANLLAEFFRMENGTAGAFSFTDPWDGKEYPNCSFYSDEIPVIFQGCADINISLVIRENPY